ncbi:MAG: carbohydrate-binding protein, partial [Verrucomicrobia bacterium]|nr:carbohydrate-binding protein [Verrucomicrobiota bacterium]
TPTIRFLAPQDGDFFTPGQALKYKVTVNDREDGSSEGDEDWLGARTMVNATWMGSDGKSVEADPGLSLMKQSDCFNCHATETRIVGPAFLDVANKYRGKEGSIEDTITRVIKGSSRVWGEAPMLPHESLHPDQVRMMVRWIYALEPGKGGANLMKGISGSISVPTDSKFKTALLEASHTDGGNGQAGPLSSSTAVRLRSRQLEAESADEKVGPQTLGPVVGAIDHGHTLLFRSLNLGDVAQARLRVSSGGSGGTIELRAGSAEGPVLAEIRVEPTGGWDKYVELITPMSAVPERKDLLIRFSNPGKGGLMNLDWIRLEPAAATPASL